MKELIFVGILAGLLFLGVGSLVNAYAKTHCLAAYADYHPQYGLFSGCRINWNWKMTPVGIIRVI